MLRQHYPPVLIGDMLVVAWTSSSALKAAVAKAGLARAQFLYWQRCTQNKIKAYLKV